MSEEADDQRQGASPAKGKNWYGDAQVWLNAERWADGHIRGLNQRAKEALTDDKNAMFADIRAVPWKLNLALEISFFARSDDISSSVWPYERFEARLEHAGTPVPDGMSIAEAVDVVLSDLDRLSRPRAKGSMAKGTWYEKNIARPLSERFAAATLGVASFSELESDESGVVYVSSGMSRGANDPSPWVDWLRGRTKDLDLETLAVLHLDVLRAPSVLRELLSRVKAGHALSEIGTDAACGLSASQDQAGEEDAAVIHAAIRLAEAVASHSRTLVDFRRWLWSTSEARLGEGELAAGAPTSSDVRQLLTGPHDPAFATHDSRGLAVRAARMYYTTLCATSEEDA